MLKRITFELDEHICNCPEQDVDWSMAVKKGHHTLFLQCSTCQTRVTVEHKDLKAFFEFPERRPLARTPLTLIIGGKADD